jgi:DNA-directed RNA polymerase I, II, and III subunit RPABC2
MADDNSDYGSVNAEEEEFENENEEEYDNNVGRPELKKLYNQHPELIIDYVESVEPKITSKDEHTTYPFITIYEKTKIIGLRANQLSQGARPYIDMKEYSYITNVRDIARVELENKLLPFIVKRPLPNGKYEYWRLSDLMIL